MADSGPKVEDLLPRDTLCISSAEPGVTAHRGDPTFLELVGKNFAVHESNAAEKLVRLKAELAEASTDDFWNILLEGMANILDAQYTFVVKRILVDDQNAAVEMPALGEEGSCLMAVALYLSDGANIIGRARDYKYEAFAGPCSHMRHDKVFIIPSGLKGFITKVAEEFAIPVDAHIGMPLFAEGKCFGHFSAMWSVEGMARRRLSWAFVEMTLHALEDVVTKRLVDGHAPSAGQSASTAPAVIPAAAITVAQSLKPYARSLSHELRTPMQGVVGMLEIMHASVEEALEARPTREFEVVLRQLRENIEVVQDSSRRAVEAADNVVHAYDLNLESPESPTASGSSRSSDGRPPQGTPSSASPVPALKRKRSGSASVDEESLSKTRVLTASQEQLVTMPVAETPHENRNSPHPADADDATIMAAIPPTRLQILLPKIITDALHSGGRPDEVVTEPSPTGYGATVHTRSQSSDGLLICKTLRWTVDSRLTDELPGADWHDISKAVLALVLNALKFTSTGDLITIIARPSHHARSVLISVADTGVGVPASFRPHLFTPFAREDDTIRRRSEGLGLGLWVARMTARRFGGGVKCVRTETEGAARGSEFELRIPLGESRRETPSRTPTPGRVGSPAGRRLAVGQAAPLRSANSEPVVSPPSMASKTRSSTLPVLSTFTTLPASSPGQINPDSFSPTPRHASSQSSRSIIPYDRHLAATHPLHFLVAEDNRINRKLLVAMLGKLGYTNVREAHDGAEAVRLVAEVLTWQDGDGADDGEDREGKEGGASRGREEQERSRRHGAPENEEAGRDENGKEGKEKAKEEAEKKNVSRLRSNAASTPSPPRIDVILMDLWMPNVDGYQATEQIFAMERAWRATTSHSHRQQPHHHHGVRILAVTADVTERAVERGRQAGMCGFVFKPFTLANLERVIMEHCI